jgi:AbrB family looped-hinge helix DNA binding protein
MANLATKKMSSKGQAVIPEEIRKRLNLKAGSQFVVVGKDNVVILKSITPPSMEEFDALVVEARQKGRSETIQNHKRYCQGAEQEVKVVLDTNVFVSGIFFTGPPYQILKAWRNGS